MKEKNLKLPIGVRILAPVVVIGLCMGIGIGLFIGWVVWPIQITNVDISDLKGPAQEDYIVLVAKTYSYDQNLDRARERLTHLNDPQIVQRVARLSLTYASQSIPESTQIAALAIALGSRDDAVALLAAAPTAPVAMVVTPTTTATASVPTLAPALTLSPTGVGTRTPTRRPTGTSASVPPTATAIPPTKTVPPTAVILPTTWLPSNFPAEWPGGAKYEPVNLATVAPGQKFWHLVQAIYCDLRDTRFDCPNRPGGSDGIGVWVTLAGGKAPLILNGSPASLEDKSSDLQCQCTYSLDFPGPTIEVGNYPSDKISGLANTSVRIGNPNTHVRYFLTFQLMTR